MRVLTAPTIVLGFLWRGFKRWTFVTNQSSLGWSLFWLIDKTMWSLCLLHVFLSTLGLILMKYMPNYAEAWLGNRELFLKGYQRAEFCFTVYVPNTSSGQICLLTLYPRIHWEYRWIETAWLWLLPGLGNLYHYSKMVICCCLMQEGDWGGSGVSRCVVWRGVCVYLVCASEGTILPSPLLKDRCVFIALNQMGPQAKLSPMLACLTNDAGDSLVAFTAFFRHGLL